MSVGNIFKSDLYKLHDFVQVAMITYPKEMIISTLRDFFSKDSYYHYVSDEWGYPKTTDHTDLPLTAGFQDNISTRLFIGENYRYDTIFYPAILVKNAGSRYVPISLNRNQGTVQYEDTLYIDGYGNKKVISTPASFVTAGAWQTNMTIDVLTRSLRARDDLVELISLCLTEVCFDTLLDAGIVVKPISVGGPSESDDRNDKLFRQSISFEIRSEYRREIKISNIIDRIVFAVDFGDVENLNNPIAPNITINAEDDITDILINV